MMQIVNIVANAMSDRLPIESKHEELLGNDHDKVLLEISVLIQNCHLTFATKHSVARINSGTCDWHSANHSAM